MLRGKDVQELEELKRQGLSIGAISRLTGYDRKTVRKYLLQPEARPVYGPRPAPPSKLDPFKEYLGDRLKAGVWNAQVLLRELRTRGYAGGYTILKDWLQPQRQAATTVAVRRFKTPPGKQAQVDWGHLGSLEMNGEERKLNAFTFTLGYSRTMMAEAALDQKLGTLLKMHEEAFRQLGGVPEEILYDRKGKVESGVKYLRRNFLCGLQGREPSGLEDLNAQLRVWVWEVANQRVHGTTHEQVAVRWDVDQFSLQPLDGRPPYPYVDDELRKVARDAYVCWQGSRYSVPWSYAGKQVWVRERGGDVEVLYGRERIAVHNQARHKHAVVTQAEHHRGIPLGARRERKTLIHIQDTAPVVEIRSLATYESVAAGGGR